ncbi:MAG: hypothetical protein WCF37_10590 [Pseudolabrys sp.]
MKTRHVVPSSTAFIAAAVGVIVLSLSSLPGYATQQGPFADLSGDWSGGGTVTLSSGSNEKIRCRATYDSQAAGNNLKLALRCASESYNVDFRGTAVNSGGNMTGNWFESTNQAAGQFFGSIKGNHIDARIEGQTFAAFFSMTTHGNRQAVSLRSPGSRVSSVTMALTRR